MVTLGNIVTLDGSSSVDVDGADGLPIEYEWIVISSPEGSVSQPLESFDDPQVPENGGQYDDNRTPTALFYPDYIGEYTIRLSVKDNFGLDSITCQSPADLTLIVRQTNLKNLFKYRLDYILSSWIMCGPFFHHKMMCLLSRILHSRDQG